MDTGGARERARQHAHEQAARLAAEGVDAVALTWVDNAGITRVKGIPASRLPHVARHGVGMSPIFDVYTSDDAVAPSPHLGGPDGDLRLLPDLRRLTVLAAQPGWAWAPVDRYDQRGAVHPACQRGFARRMADRAAAEGIAVTMGFETEWLAAEPGPDDPVVPAGHGPAYGMTRVVHHSGYLREVFTALAAEHVEVLQIHPEYTPGQFEVSTAPADPVAAADDLVLVRETVRAVTVRHGLRASFAPVVVAGQVGNGCHLHVGLRATADGTDLLRDGTGRYGMTPTGEAFLAGVVDALPALLAVGAPSPVSGARLIPSHWAGAFQCWGLENREAALRFVAGPPDEPGSANAEVKCFDAAANPYLVTGAVIAAGLAGVAAGLTLPEPVAGDPVHHPGAVRLPGTLTEAADRLAAHPVLAEALGEVLLGAVLAVRRAEAAQFEGHSPEKIAAAVRWRY
ncbi:MULTISPECIES: type I glutamate--ammonia ligase [Streptomycetaceae]|uniref:Glutamine synthetase catalytic region n=1 Tax=Streptantibioticus cattleyicolor (strain ATCC 35852 / DSM 46488 / JCM 4925 / NBRC 14057 / NRRL 8057) TaxID=1003195 RepID=F8JYY7_STREN|nr:MULTISPECIES: glutamine synthetase [Streptomycetaceae]AEW93458.1 glutamine synthetase catalytic region [Streptantibioticus cattleyicolor NRRL 8057 = DSM 46488]MYS58170.1 glutamine synthetase [Streptomyces sp. SID5468]CCB73813.1 Glutamine synthetase catalytic region [Streptantibioticus cattleyicolor NRRL 8057 = DSM 46488]